MENSITDSEKVRRLVGRFRVLHGWDISLRRDPKYASEVSIHLIEPRAVIYACHQTAPRDFELHEVLHCALRAFKRTDDKASEESLVQDICALITDETRFACEQSPEGAENGDWKKASGERYDI